MAAPARLTDSNFAYPAHLPVAEVIARVRAILNRAKFNREVLLHPAFGLPEAGTRMALKAGVSPLVWLLAFEREQSLLTQEADPGVVEGEWDTQAWPKTPFKAADYRRPAVMSRAASTHYLHAGGVVGQDQAGTRNRNWDSLVLQMMMTCELNAWYLGIGPDANFGFRPDLWPGAAGRWPKTKTIEILDSKHRSVEVYTAQSAAEFAQLTFTPHLATMKNPDPVAAATQPVVHDPNGDNVLDRNAVIAQMFPEFL